MELCFKIIRSIRVICLIFIPFGQILGFDLSEIIFDLISFSVDQFTEGFTGMIILEIVAQILRNSLIVFDVYINVFISKNYILRNVSRISNIEAVSKQALKQNKYCFIGYPSVKARARLQGVRYIQLEERIFSECLLLSKKNSLYKTFCDKYSDRLIKMIDEFRNK